jgi:hypothetical protein
MRFIAFSRKGAFLDVPGKTFCPMQQPRWGDSREIQHPDKAKIK